MCKSPPQLDYNEGLLLLNTSKTYDNQPTSQSSCARHGRFDYLTETLRLSQYDDLQSHHNSEVKIKHMQNIPLFGQSSFFKFLLFGFQMCLNPHQGQFWKP